MNLSLCGPKNSANQRLDLISGLMAHLFRQEKISPAELQRLRRIVDEAQEALPPENSVFDEEAK